MTRTSLLIGRLLLTTALLTCPLNLVLAQEAPVEAPQKFNADEPLVTERQYFTYHCLSSRNVTLRTFKGFDAHKMMKMMGSNPKAALDHLGLLILVEKALEGVDVATMPSKNLDRLVEEQITAELMKIGRENEARALYSLADGDTPRMPSVASMVSLLESFSYRLVRAISHQRPLLSNPNLHTNG